MMTGNGLKMVKNEGKKAFVVYGEGVIKELKFIFIILVFFYVPAHCENALE